MSQQLKNHILCTNCTQILCSIGYLLFGFDFFLSNGISTFVVYLMSKPPLWKNNLGRIQAITGTNYTHIHIMLEITMTRKSDKHLHAKYRTAVSTLSGFISSTHRDLHHWRSNQQPQYAKAETLPMGHGLMPHISDAKLTSHGKLRDHHIYIYI